LVVGRMKQEKISEFKRLLAERKRRLLRRAQELLVVQKKLEEIDPMDYEDDDILSLELDETFMANIDEVERARLKEIDDAAARLNAGKDVFGTCEECGAAIAEMRLVARPEVRFCAVCGNKRTDTSH
jgi:DnaK suppressor protein